MLIIFRIILFMLLLINFLSAQTSSIIKIIVISYSLSETENIFISGNNAEFGNWQPDKILLNKIDSNKWERIFTFENNTLLEFKFTKGSWDSESLDENRNIPGNFNLTITNDTTIIYNINYWNDGNAKISFKGQVTGNVISYKQMSYEGILPRDIIVWLPPGYDQNIKTHYSVLYMNDGQNLFDPNNSLTKVDWQIDEVADSLIKNNIIDSIIIVGICNTKDRGEEYSATPKGSKYMEFIIKKLKPFIDSTYRTLPDRKYTAVGGSSSGGLISFMLTWNYSDYFSKAICFSPAFKYEDFDYTKIVENYFGLKKDIKIMIYNGGIGLEQTLQTGVDLMIDKLERKGFTLDKDLFVEKDSLAEHNEAAWAKHIYFPLEKFFPKMQSSIKKNLQIEKVKLNKSKRNILSNRFRVQLSAVSTLDKDNFELNIPMFLNLNYRFSSVDSLSLQKDFSSSFSVEPGINIFFGDFVMVPYVKIGPEFRIYKNFYFDFHGGVGLLVADLFNSFGLFPIFYYGSEAGYILNQSEDFSIELELGTNGFHPFYLYYFSVLFSF